MSTSTRPSATPEPTVRLVTRPAEGRQPPATLVAALQAIDPSVTLFYVGDGVWWLGSVQPNEYRQRDGEMILAHEATRSIPNPRNVFLGKLAVEGFARIEAYVGPDPSGLMVVNPGADNEYTCTILEDFRQRDHNWRVDRKAGEQVAKERMEESLGEPERREAEAKAIQYARTDARAHYRREMRDRKSFGFGGVTGGRGSGIIISPYE